MKSQLEKSQTMQARSQISMENLKMTLNFKSRNKKRWKSKDWLWLLENLNKSRSVTIQMILISLNPRRKKKQNIMRTSNQINHRQNQKVTKRMKMKIEIKLKWN